MADLQSTICTYEGGPICRPKHFDCAGGILAGRSPPNAENHHFDLCCDPGCGAASQLGRAVSPVVYFGPSTEQKSHCKNHQKFLAKNIKTKIRKRPMQKQSLIVAAAAFTSAVLILNGTSASTAQQTPKYEVGGFPITPLQMLALQPSAKIKEQQRLSRQRTMDASRRAVVRDPVLANSGW